MHISEFDFELPSELIAQVPLKERDHSRMLIVDRQSRTWKDCNFFELPNFLSSNDVLVINDTRVFPARLIGHRVTNGRCGAKIEALLTHRITENQWEVLAKPGRALPVGSEVIFGNGKLTGKIIAIAPEGRRIIGFQADGDLENIIDQIGNTPLPPYIKRDYDEQIRLDEPSYQTIYAKARGAIAAPTAGLHFTDRIFAELKQKKIGVIEITHHVGIATFQPVRVENIEEHSIDSESYEITDTAAAAINEARAAGKRIIAVGTTTTRALESSVDESGIVRSGFNSTQLFIYPGYQFRVVNSLITNFHLPKSSLLFLVSALAGRELIFSAYHYAIDKRYRFYSYGDCMFIT